METIFENRGVSIADRAIVWGRRRGNDDLPPRQGEPVGDGGAATVHPLAAGEPTAILKARQSSAPAINLTQWLDPAIARSHRDRHPAISEDRCHRVHCRLDWDKVSRPSFRTLSRKRMALAATTDRTRWGREGPAS